MPAKDSTYIGRFAPSPSGPLHFGSLIAALASYLDARACGGQWLVRVEDVDPPREPPSAASAILKALDVYGLHWDREVLYQSHRTESYLTTIEQLNNNGFLYPCACTRKDLQGYGGVYPGICRDKTLKDDQPFSLRVRCRNEVVTFNDQIQGHVQYALSDLGDFIIRRKDGLFAYQLAVVVDDAFQKVNHIVRGSDLLSATPWQLYLQSLMGLPQPVYAHFPVITLEDGDKLSKQNHAPAIPLKNPEPLLFKALQALGQHPDTGLQDATAEEIIRWGIEHWQLDNIPKAMTSPLSALS